LATKGTVSATAVRPSESAPSAQGARKETATAALPAASTASAPPASSPDESAQSGAEPTPTADALNAIRNDIQTRIRRDFSRHFNYPPLARRHGWEGAVRLGYDVSPEGRVINVRVLASSGYPVLDRNAQETLSRVPPLEPTGWHRPIQALELAVHYQLMEG
jgi:protein TonB